MLRFWQSIQLVWDVLYYETFLNCQYKWGFLYLKEEDKINVKTEADSVDDVRFPSTCTEELINVKREMTEVTAFVDVKAETDNEVGCYHVVENISPITLV